MVFIQFIVTLYRFMANGTFTCNPKRMQDLVTYTDTHGQMNAQKDRDRRMDRQTAHTGKQTASQPGKQADRQITYR